MPFHVGRRLVAVAAVATAPVVVSGLDASSAGAKVDGYPARAADRPTWSDEFDRPAGTLPDRSKWTFETGGRWENGTELQQYTDRAVNAAHDGKGNLAITARRETYTGDDGVRRRYTSARITTRGRFSFRYGKVEARLKIPVRSGLLPAFWTLGTDIDSAGWPASGEIDVMEVPGSDRWGETGTVQYHLHGPGRSEGALIEPPRGIHERWHTYGAVWTPNAVRFTFDGRVRRTITRAQLGPGWRAFRKRHFLILNIAVGNSWTGAPRRSERFPATMLVDWVRHDRRG